MTCSQLVESGAYVLGALSPAQRLMFERHMATCGECQAEVNELAVLPGLLGRIDEPTAVAAGDLPPPTVLPGVLAKVHKQRRGRRLVAVAAGVVVAFLALVAGLNMPTLATAKPKAPVQVPVAAFHEMLPVASTEPLTAQVAFTKVDGGTKLLLKCQYPWKAGTTYGTEHNFSLVVYPRSGGPAQQVIAWGATPGRDVSADGMTAWSVADMARVELRSADGDPMLIYDVPA
jgi:hypothetical protein